MHCFRRTFTFSSGHLGGNLCVDISIFATDGSFFHFLFLEGFRLFDGGIFEWKIYVSNLFCFCGGGSRGEGDEYFFNGAIF